MESVKNFIKNVVIFAHSFLVQKIDDQYLIPVYLNRELLILPFYKNIRPLSFNIIDANESEKVILSKNISYKYGFDHPIQISMDIFDDDRIIKREFIV